MSNDVNEQAFLVIAIQLFDIMFCWHKYAEFVAVDTFANVYVSVLWKELHSCGFLVTLVLIALTLTPHLNYQSFVIVDQFLPCDAMLA